MFYPVDSLRKGGRFYLLWMADSWPHRFAMISHRQLWSQDVRKLCDELIDVMISESGRPTHRYSLRLSSQLMRGLVRLYQRKVSVFLSDLCMTHANVIKHSNKRYQDVTEQTRDKPQRQVAVEHRRTAALEEPENEYRVEEILQNSTNVVANIQDITLREAVINEPILPPNEGFGEENAEQVLQFLANRSVEQMLAQTDSVAQHSALELACNITDKSHDTRPPAHTRMEQISELDLTLLRPSDGGLLSVTDLGKEIPNISDVPIIPIRELPDPQEKLVHLRQPQESVVAIEQPRDQPRGREREIVLESTQIELEELEEIEPRAKRRRKLIIDKKIKITSDVLQARIQNPRVDLAHEYSSEAIIEIQVPFELYMNRPCHAGVKERSSIAPVLTRMFMRNLGVVNKESANSEFEVEEMQRPQNYHTRSHLEHILEVSGPVALEPQIETVPETSAAVEENIPEMVANVADIDIADMVTQKLGTLSQNKEKGKRTSDESTPSPKKQKSGYISSRENQKTMRESEISTAALTVLPELVTEVDKENIAANRQALTPRISKRGEHRTVTTMLYEAGLSDMPGQPSTDKDPVTPQAKQSRRLGSESSGSLLGSLDRTKVSLGDSDATTDSKRFIRDQWGTEGTMLKIIKYINMRHRGESITIPNLVARGPIINELSNIITAKCFSSVLKLKQHGFITIRKCPKTLEILDIMLGPSFQLEDQENP